MNSILYALKQVPLIKRLLPGSFYNTYLFNPTKDKYYAMILMRMNAKDYTLVNYAYAIFEILVGFGLFGSWIGYKLGLSLWQCVLIPLFVTGIKMTVAAYYLWDFEKTGIATDENKLGIWFWGVILLLLGVAYGLPALGVVLPTWISVLFMAVCVLGGVPALYRILSFDHYQEVYRQLLAKSAIHENIKNTMVQEQKEQSRKVISANVEIGSKKEGFGVLLVFWINPSFKAQANGALMVLLPYFLFIMYAFNRGADSD